MFRIRKLHFILDSRYDLTDLYLNLTLLFCSFYLNEDFVSFFMFIVTGLSNLLRLFWPKRPNPYVTVFLQSLTVTSWALLATVSVQQLSVIVTGILTLAAVVSVLRTPK